MRYILISHHTITAVQRQRINGLCTLFYKEAVPVDSSSGHDFNYTWTEHVDEARMFQTEQDAWFFAFGVWGMDYAKKAFYVASVRDELIESTLKTRQAFGEISPEMAAEAI